MKAENKQDDSAVENQITEFKQNLDKKSNEELSQVVSQLQNVENAALKQKISNQLDSIQESITQPNDNQAPFDTQDKISSQSSAKGQDSHNDKNEDAAENQEQSSE